jgi:hypothetical protein
MMFGVRAFKQADTLETEIEAMVETMSQQALMPPQEQPGPPLDPNIAAQQQADAVKFQDAEAQRAHDIAMADKKMQMAQVDNMAKVEIEKAKRPSPDELAPVVQPMVQIMQAFTEQMQAMLQQTVTQLAAIAAAPKDVVVQRDEAGRISGGRATPRLN